MTLYRSNLFSVVNCDLRPMSQYICRILWFMWFFFAIIWGLHVNERSSMRPRYLTSCLTGNWIPYNVTCGQSIFRFVKVTWTDLVSLTFTRRSRDIVPQILDLGAVWSCVVNFTTRCFYVRRKISYHIG